jgi:hypothetical protein
MIRPHDPKLAESVVSKKSIMTEPHIDFELEHLARITQPLTRDEIEKLLFKLVANFLQREAVLTVVFRRNS